MPEIPPPSQIPDPERLTQLVYLLDSIHSKTNASNAYLKALVSKLDSNTAKLVQKIDQGVQVQAEVRQDLNNLAAWLAGVVQRQDLTNELLTRLLNKETGFQTPSETLTQILEELRSEIDEGLGYTYTGTATTTLTVIDLAKGEPYHPVRAIIFKNTGATTIKFAINNGALAYRRSVDGNSVYNRSHPKGRPINKFFLQTDSGSSTYELEVLW